MRPTSEQSNTDLAQLQLLRALNHEVRLQILGILGQRELSPAELARERGEPVSNVAYHFRMLEELGCAKVVRTRQVRGSVEHFYRGSGVVHYSWSPAMLDQAGLEELAVLLRATCTAIGEIETRAAARLGRNGHGDTALLAMVALAGFAAPAG